VAAAWWWQEMQLKPRFHCTTTRWHKDGDTAKKLICECNEVPARLCANKMSEEQIQAAEVDHPKLTPALQL